MKNLILAFLVLFTTSTYAKEPELVAIATDHGGYPAKALCFFSNNYMVPHPEGLLVLYTCLGGPDINSEIWLVNERPKHIGTSQMGNLFSGPFVRGKDIFFIEFAEFGTRNVWKYSNGELTSYPLPETLNNSHVHDFALLGDVFYFRYTNHSTGEHGEGIFKDEFIILPARGPRFFYKASSNGEMMFQKTILAEGEVVELRTHENPEPVVLLRDKKNDPSSPFNFLRNQFAQVGKKWVTVATTAKGLTLIRGEGTNYSTEDLSAHFKDIQHWPPALAKDGEVVFRATDHSGLFALWGYKNGTKRVIVGPDQEIPSESVFTSNRALLYNSPVFDDNGRLYIGVGLRQPGDSVDFGQGVLAL